MDNLTCFTHRRMSLKHIALLTAVFCQELPVDETCWTFQVLRDPFLQTKVETAVYDTECPTRYWTRHFFNNYNTNEDIATKFEQDYSLFFHISYTMRLVRFKFHCNILISGKIIKETPGSVASGTPCIMVTALTLRRLMSYIYIYIYIYIWCTHSWCF